MWVTVAEAVAALGVTERTVWRRIKRGQLDTRTDDGRTLVFVRPTPDTGPDVRPDAPGALSGSELALVERHEHELAAIARRLGQAEARIPRHPWAWPTVAAALLFALAGVAGVGHHMLVNAQSAASLADARLVDVQAQLDQVRGDLRQARADRDRATARLLDVALVPASQPTPTTQPLLVRAPGLLVR